MAADDAEVTTARGGGRPARVHRALSSPVRTRLLGLLRATDGAHDVQDLATHLGLHVNTVRAHLAVLEDAALVESAPQPRDRPGRPRLLYRATEQVADVAGGRSYRQLAEVLTTQVEALAVDPGAAAEGAGRSWGHDLAVRAGSPARAREDDDGPTSVEEALAAVMASLDELGFRPELDRSDASRPRVLLHQCPFVEVAREHQDVVCSVHLGLMRGMLEELGTPVEVASLVPFVEPTLCVADLAGA